MSTRSLAVATNLGLLCLAAGTAAGFVRLFDGTAFLGDLAIVVAASWLVALVCRATQRSIVVTVAVSVSLAVVVLAMMFAGGDGPMGIPDASSVAALRESVVTSFGEFSSVRAPVPATDGFLVIAAAGLWIFGLFADIAAMRLRGPVQAAIPYCAAFVACGLLANDAGRDLAALSFVVGIGLYALSQVTLRTDGLPWLAAQRTSGTRQVLRSAVGLVGAALLVALVAAPLVPDSVEPLVDIREIGRSDGPRTVISPFVGVRSLLVERSDEIMFRVDADQGAYWRLTSLDRYDPDREIWVSRGSYQRTDGVLPGNVDNSIDGPELQQTFDIEALSGIWLPGAYEPRRISTEMDVSYDRDSSSIIVRDRIARGGAYELESTLVDLDAVRRAVPGDESDVDASYLDVPVLSDAAQLALRDATAGASPGYEQAIALQNWFRDSFSYDESVDYSQRPDALDAFLEDRAGFCQQFTSAFAAMARSLGLPSRVAVGFTQGDGVDGGFVVRGRHAHTWPELYFRGVGWVPFEPTPQRGNPQAVSYTGVPAQQAPAPVPETTTTLVAPAVPVPPTTAAPTTTTEPGSEVASSTAADDLDSSGTVPWLPIGVIVTLTLAAGAVGWSLHRRRSEAEAGRSATARAWERAVDALARLGVVARVSDTPVELAARATAQIPDLAPLDLERLAWMETVRRYGPAGSASSEDAGSIDISDAERIAEQVHALAAAGSGTRRTRRSATTRGVGA